MSFGLPKAPVKETSTADALELSRLQSIKAYGRSAVPWDIRDDWRGKVIAELERFVTPGQFPKDLSLNEAVNIVRARVVEVLRSLRDAESAARRERDTSRNRIGSGRCLSPMVTNMPGGRRATGIGPHELTLGLRLKGFLPATFRLIGPSSKTEDAVNEVLDAWDEEDEEELEED